MRKEIEIEQLILEISSNLEKAKAINNDVIENFFKSRTHDELITIIPMIYEEFNIKSRVVQDYICATICKVEKLEKETGNA